MVIENRSPNRLISFTALLIVLIFISILIFLKTKSASYFRTVLKQSILKELIRINPPAPGEKVDVIYILGGNQTSMEFKSKTASEFFHEGICKKIWVMNLPGITEYSQALERNWTNNEYSLLKLNEFGIPDGNIEIIKINAGFFGTLSEAEDISNLLKAREYKSLLLVAQPYHTHRTKMSFNKYLAEYSISLYVQDSGEQMIFRHLIVEYFKLKIYQYFLVS